MSASASIHGRVLLLDAGLGNLHSVERALRAAAALDGASLELEISGDPAVLARADRVVFPGQGAFRDAAEALERDGGALRQALDEHIAKGAPYLGLCLGLQVLFETSDEAPGARGLGVLAGHVARFDPERAARYAQAHGDESGPIKIPHMGWNEARPASPEGAQAFGLGPEGDWFYFVHSFHAAPDDPSCVALETTHGYPFASAIARDALLAVQFHPEKSQSAGLSLLRHWLAR